MLPALAAGSRRPGVRVFAVCGILALAAVVRVHGLSSQLWVDEIDALRNSIRRPSLSIVTEWPASTPHPLADLAAHASVRMLGESPWTVRLPAALFGVAGVLLLYLVGRRALGGTAALLPALLMAVWTPHVFQSQNARGYTALLFFFLAASGLLLRICEDGDRPLARAGYVLAAALGAYALFFGVVMVPAHVLAVAAVAAGGPRWGWTGTVRWRGLLARAAAAVGLVALLYAPLVPSLLAFVRLQSWKPGECTARSGWLAPLGMLGEGVAGLAEGFGGFVGLGLALLAAAVGLPSWARRHPWSLAVLAMPVLLQALVSAVANVPLNPRYFVLALPLLLLAVGHGVAVAVERASAGGAGARRLAFGLTAVAMLVWASPLLRYYATPKQDFLGALRRVDERAVPGDVRVGVHLAGRVFRDHYHAPFRSVDSLEEVASVEAEGRRVWLVTTLERHLQAVRPELYRHIHDAYREWGVLPATVRDAEMRLYVREPPSR